MVTQGQTSVTSQWLTSGHRRPQELLWRFGATELPRVSTNTIPMIQCQTPVHPQRSRCIGDRGEIIDAGDPELGNRFRLRFVFLSCVRASGRGEAVWARERGVFVSAGPQNGEMYSSSRGCVPGVCVAMRMFFVCLFIKIVAVCVVALVCFVCV